MMCSQPRKIALGLAAVIGLLAPISSMAYPATYTNSTSQPITDNSSIISDILIVDVGTIAGLTVTVAIDHTWVGDLIIRLTGPDATVVTLMDRPGRPPTAMGGFGDSSNLSATYPILFDDGAALPAEDLGSSPTGCNQTSSIIGLDCTSTAAPDDPLSTFIGDPLSGTWRLFISDNAAGDQGRLASWSLNFDVSAGGGAVPEPSGLALMGAALLSLLVAARRRRKT